MLNISRTTLYDWMEKGILKPVDMYPSRFKRRPKLMFRESELKELMPSEPVEHEHNEESDKTKDTNKLSISAA
jgi:hypothetical protein